MVEPDFITSYWVCLDSSLLVDNPQSIVARPLEIQLVLPQVLLHLGLIVRPKHVTPAFQARWVTQQTFTSVVIPYVHYLDIKLVAMTRKVLTLVASCSGELIQDYTFKER